MNVKRFILSGGISLLVIGASASNAKAPTKIEPLPQTAFKPVILRDVDKPYTPIILDHKETFNRTKPKITQLVPKAQVVVKSSPTVGIGPNKVKGTATYYCLRGVSPCHYKYSGGMYAAAGSELQIGNWRGRTVTVTYKGHPIQVTLIDSCGCGENRIIDLYSDAFKQLAPLGTGTLEGVVVSW